VRIFGPRPALLPRSRSTLRRRSRPHDANSILGSIIIALNGPSEHGSSDIRQFEKLFVSPGFLAWGGVCLVAAAAMVFFVAPRYGKKNMLVYIVICSLLGGLSVACTSGLGGAILSSIRNHDSSQWTYWFMYFLLAFCVVTLLLEINYLNKALELFNTAMGPCGFLFRPRRPSTHPHPRLQ